MIIQEQISGTLIRTYSNADMYIHGGYPEADYEEAIDPISSERTYTETDISIERAISEEEYAEVGKIFMGVKK